MRSKLFAPASRPELFAKALASDADALSFDHPTPVPLANAVFRPTDTEISAALRIVEAARGAERNGVGAYLVDGRMIDIPFVKRAESVLGAARRLGLIPTPRGA